MQPKTHGQVVPLTRPSRTDDVETKAVSVQGGKSAFLDDSTKRQKKVGRTQLERSQRCLLQRPGTAQNGGQLLATRREITTETTDVRRVRLRFENTAVEGRVEAARLAEAKGVDGRLSVRDSEEGCQRQRNQRDGGVDSDEEKEENAPSCAKASRESPSTVPFAIETVGTVDCRLCSARGDALTKEAARESPAKRAEEGSSIVTALEGQGCEREVSGAVLSFP
jgi:hypothetical protein